MEQAHDTIYRQAAIEQVLAGKLSDDSFVECVEECNSMIEWAVDVLMNLPSVEQKRGKWIHREDMDYKDENGVFHWHGMCGECEFIHDFLDGHTAQYNFCPNCGADMRQ